MQAKDLVIGGKYVPHQKTAGCEMFESEWEINKLKQPFLFYLGVNRAGLHIFSIKMEEIGLGEFFNPEDIMPYVENSGNRAKSPTLIDSGKIDDLIGSYRSKVDRLKKEMDSVKKPENDSSNPNYARLQTKMNAYRHFINELSDILKN